MRSYAAKMWKNAYETRFTGAEELPDVEHIKTRELQCKGVPIPVPFFVLRSIMEMYAMREINVRRFL